MATYREAEAAQEVASAILGDDDNVAGIGVARANGGFGVRVNLESPGSGLPPEINGVPVLIRVVGRIEADA